MNVRFFTIAEIELTEAIAFYNYQSSGLGDEFLFEILDVIKRIQQFPHAWGNISKRARRCKTKKFPYGVIYHLSKEEILIVAIAHLHREPEYWKDRV